MHLLLMFVLGEHAGKRLSAKSASFCGVVMAHVKTHHLNILIGGSAVATDPPTCDIPIHYLDYIV